MIMSKLDELEKQRNELKNQYKELLEVIRPLEKKKEKIKSDIFLINKEIYNINGHVLLKDSYTLTKMYGYVYRCLNCGELICEINIKENDKIINNKKEYKKTLHR